MRRTALTGLAVIGAVVCALGAPEMASADPRVRGGFNLDGGYFGSFTDSNRADGGSISLGGRIGVQISEVFALYYQNSPMGWFMFRNTGPQIGASDYNSLLVDFTIEDTLGLGIGPSLDLLTSATFHGTSGPVEPGAHARIALLVGSSSGISRRQSFAIGLDPHVTYFDKGVLLSLAGGIGAEWY